MPLDLYVPRLTLTLQKSISKSARTDPGFCLQHDYVEEAVPE